MKKIKYIYSLIYLLILFAVTGCSSSVAIKANSSKSIDVKLSLNTGSGIQGLLDSYGVAIDDEALSQIKKAFEDYGFYNVKTSSKSKSSILIEGSTKDFSQQQIVSVTDSSLTLSISPKTMQALAQALPEESRYYLDMFAAPVFTGEEMSQEEYTDLLALIYGSDVAQDIQKAILKVTLESPKGNKTAFQMPVIEFLTLSTEKSFSIKY